MTDDLELLIREICRDYAKPWTISVPPELCPRSKQAAQAVQDEVRRRLGVEPVAWKLGMTSEMDQSRAGDDVPITGWLTSAMVLEPSARVTLEGCSGTVVECEIALELGKDLLPDGQVLTIDEVSDAVVAVRAAIELPISRFAGDVRPAPNLMEAVNSASYRLIVGTAESVDAVEALSEVEGLLEVNGTRRTSGRLPRAERANPLHSLLYLANNLAQRGEGLAAGQIVTTGVNLDPLEPRPGDYRFILPALGEVRLLIQEESGTPSGR